MVRTSFVVRSLLVLVLTGFALGGVPVGASAQGSVAGRVVILEEGGARTLDLANTVVFIERSGAPSPRPTATERIIMVSREFMPAVRIVTAGTRVEFPNDDPFRHNVFSNAGPGEFDLGLYGRGQSRGFVFSRAGVYPIFCNIHARMVAFVLAVETPYFAQAGADGRFTVAGVPPGRHTLRVWHDRGGEHAREIEVPANGLRDLTIELDARAFRAVQHRNKFGQEYRSATRDRY